MGEAHWEACQGPSFDHWLQEELSPFLLCPVPSSVKWVRTLIIGYKEAPGIHGGTMTRGAQMKGPVSPAEGGGFSEVERLEFCK